MELAVSPQRFSAFAITTCDTAAVEFTIEAIRFCASTVISILTQREGDLIDLTDPVAAQPFLPLVWATAISMRAEKDGYIRNPHALVNLIQCAVLPHRLQPPGDNLPRQWRVRIGEEEGEEEEKDTDHTDDASGGGGGGGGGGGEGVINGFRESLLKLFLMDKVCVPLVYTQVSSELVFVLMLVLSLVGVFSFPTPPPFGE
ncbi:unnamed protein product [Hydatigera taeniaeformis]|uniref:Uncharacterized protein n=1 Tax=Hydatigena taeniaeformis TaxID=6205 RepID=A0A0R3WP87_HYDTA|nr:unnamed protein product [Hydatigera taeniaeformis]